MTETEFKERIVLPALQSLKDIYILKTQERGRKGVPDILACYRGRFIAIELKRDGKKPTRLQQHKLNQISAAGGVAFFAQPSTWFVQFGIIKGIV